MAENKLASISETRVEENVNEGRRDMEREIAELRAEISRLTESLSAIGNSAAGVARGEAELLVDRLRNRIRAEPVQAVLTVAGVGFLFGLFANR